MSDADFHRGTLVGLTVGKPVYSFCNIPIPGITYSALPSISLPTLSVSYPPSFLLHQLLTRWANLRLDALIAPHLSSFLGGILQVQFSEGFRLIISYMSTCVLLKDGWSSLLHINEAEIPSYMYHRKSSRHLEDLQGPRPAFRAQQWPVVYQSRSDVLLTRRLWCSPNIKPKGSFIRSIASSESMFSPKIFLFASLILLIL